VALRKLFAALVFATAGVTAANALDLDSGESRVALVELYTSEGCSSCPPADQWISALKDDQRLWKQVVPIAFHVDYWDYIGWRDRFATPEYSLRQKTHQQLGNVYSVYTPGFLVNGREWRGWFSNPRLQIGEDEMPGRLTASINDGVLRAAFVPTRPNGRYQLNFAVLGMDLLTAVERGENAGKELRHDFVVIDMQSWILRSKGNGKHAISERIKLPQQTGSEVGKNLGVAVWVSAPGSQVALQAAGGLLSMAQ
jgi:hypothetical protein